MRRPRLVLVLFSIAVFGLGVLVGSRLPRASSGGDHRRFVPVPADVAWYEPEPAPSPTMSVGLHDYAVPISPSETAPAPSASPASSRLRRRPAAGHTGDEAGRRNIRTHDRLTGSANWHATGRDGRYAAACRPLRRAMGPGWRGEQVIVTRRDTPRFLVVTLNDWCASTTKTIDLSDEAFDYLGRLSAGVLRVVVEWP